MWRNKSPWQQNSHVKTPYILSLSEAMILAKIHLCSITIHILPSARLRDQSGRFDYAKRQRIFVIHEAATCEFHAIDGDIVFDWLSIHTSNAL